MENADRAPASLAGDPAALKPRYFDVVAVISVAVYLISQAASAKLISIAGLVYPGAIILFPLAYIGNDVVTEVYGFAASRRVIWLSFAMAVLFSLVLWAVQVLPAAPGWNHQRSYEVILGFVPRIIVASIVAFWAGDFANSFVLAKMKVATRGRFLWARTIGSTVVGQAADSVVFCVGAFLGLLPIGAILAMAATTYVTKCAYEAAATPLTYAIVGRLKRAEGVDVYDRGTNFTPFKF